MKGTAKAIKVRVEANQTRKSTSALSRRRARQSTGKGDGSNAAFMPPSTMKILGEGRPRGPRRGVTGKLTTNAAMTFDAKEESGETQW